MCTLLNPLWTDAGRYHLHTRRVKEGSRGGQLWTVERRAGLESRMWHSLRKGLKDSHRGGGDNDDADNNHQDAEDQRTDIQAFGSGGVGLGSNHITHHLPVPGLEETRCKRPWS